MHDEKMRGASMARPKIGSRESSFYQLRFTMDSILDLPSGPKKARMEIVPLIDVIFFLLATFVLFTLSLDKIRALDVPLPKVPPTPDIAVDYTTVFLQASEPGTFYWKRGTYGTVELLTLAEIRPRLEHYKRTEPNPRVLVRGDNQARFGSTVLILEEVRLAKIKQVSVETIVSKAGN
jgi:biopolymer transport protein ExbD